jgi:ATP-binding cassette subfamily B protein
VKAFARQDYERTKYEAANKERFRRGRAFMSLHSVYWPLTDILCGFQIIGGLTVAALLVIDRQLTLGTYLAFAGLITQIINPMRNLGRIIVAMSEGAVSYRRVTEMIKEEREPLKTGTHRPEGDLRGEIVFDNVSFAYEAETPVLHNISFHAAPGQVVALLGSTGSGKTTLVNLLPRFYDYSSGSITLDGVELRDYTREYLRSQIGIVEQEPFLFSRSIKENIAYSVGRAVSDDEVIAAAKAAAIHDSILKFPEGYATLVGERGVTLSGGQKQRVALARTLLKNPRVLILDDATSSVDTETEAAIREALNNMSGARTTFLIAHRIQSVMRADLILVMDKGHIVQRGTHESLLNEPGIYRQIFDVQTRIEQELKQELAVTLPTQASANGHDTSHDTQQATEPEKEIAHV